MASVNLYQKFDYTDSDGNLYSDGSTSTAKTISIANDELFDRTYRIGGGTANVTEILSDDKLSSFAFLWIESSLEGYIQLLCNEGGSINTDNMEVGFVLKLAAGVPLILPNDTSRNAEDVDTATTDAMLQSAWATEIDTWETRWGDDVIDRIEFYHTGGASTYAKVRVFAAR